LPTRQVMMLGMSRRRNRLVWIAFAAIPLTALVIVLVIAPKSAPTEATRQIRKIQLGMTRDEVEAAIGMRASTSLSWVRSASGEIRYWAAVWDFADESAISVTFPIYRDKAVEIQELFRGSPPRYVRIRDTLRSGVNSYWAPPAVLGLVVVGC